VADVVALDAALGPAPVDALEAAVAGERYDLGPRVQRDVRRLLDAADEVARHRGRQPVAADEHVDVRRLRGEVDRGLPGRVAAADADDVLAGAELGLDVGRAVVDARALEALELGDADLVVAGAAGDDDGASGDARAVVQRDRERARRAVEPLGDARDRDGGA